MQTPTSPTPHLVLIPGLDGTGQLFEPFLSALPPGIETTVVSFPHEQILNEHEIFACIRNVIPWNRTFTLLGESTSGPIALRFAAAQFQNVSGLILVSSFVSDPIAASANWATAFLSRPWFQKPVTPVSVRKHLLGRLATDDLVGKAVQALRTPWPEVLGSRIEYMRRRDARETLQAWPKPILYLQGDEDAFISQASVDEVTAVNPAVEVVTLSGPHLLLQANPSGAAQAVAKFVNAGRESKPHAA